MKVLIEHIEKLLPDHDCVVVPGLGGFVQNEVPARFDAESDFFYPKGKEIGFNSRLTFNDGFLAQAYQESFDISFEESNLQIRQAVQEIKNKIDNGKYVSLGRIGVIWKNDKEQTQFRSENKNYFYPESYGLTSFSFPKIEKRRQSRSDTERVIRKHQDNEFINIRLHRDSFRNMVIGIAACLFLLFLSKPTGTLPGTNSQEAFMMHDYLVIPESMESGKKEALPVIDEQAPVATIDETSANLSNEGNIATISERTIEPATKAQKITAPIPARTYYIVVGSFPQKRLAERWIQENSQQSKFKYAGIVEKDGRARVYTKSFPDKNVAQAYLNQFRENNPECASAWLLSVKNN
ncbi:MAG: SPOR domain-containing protein [Bacteroidales bacterium]|nr:SPOR domain-containing protein [Bacteroidales bacterium]